MKRLFRFPTVQIAMVLFACFILSSAACDQPDSNTEDADTGSLKVADTDNAKSEAIDLLDEQIEGEASAPEGENFTASGLRLMELEVLAANAVDASKEGRHAEAATIIKELVRRDPTNTRVLLRLADNQFMALEIEESLKTYDRLIEIAPSIEPQLWQRGLALYYAERYQDGVEQFEKHWVVNRQDVENSVWHMLCGAKATSVEEARKKLIDIQRDTRVPMKQILQMFAGDATPEDVIEAARQPNDNPFMAKMNVYYGHLYNGLYYEMIGDKEKSLNSMKLAQENSILEKNHLMSQVANIHLSIRGPKEESENADTENADTESEK